jgi:CDP-diacylglycerol---glycerol-3-phosphate 3-phosphatidyltransferase
MKRSGPKKQRNIREEFTNIPNMLTMGRICLIPPVMVLMLESTPYSAFWAAILFSIAAITDYLDGYIARKMGLVSLLGKLLDPLADKLIVMATLVVAAQLGHIPGWFVVLLLAREIGITGLRSIAGQEGLVIDVVQSGKFKTALQLCGLIGVILHYPYAVDFVFVQTVVDFSSLGFALLGLSMVFSILSAFSYFTRFMLAIDSKKKDGSIPIRPKQA